MAREGECKPVIKTPSRDGRTAPAASELDHIFDSLRHGYRRSLLYTLLEDEQASLWERASRIAAWEEDGADAPSEDAIKRVYVTLYHSHVPKLVDYGVIAFGPDDESVRPSTNTEQVLSVLEEAIDATTGDRPSPHDDRAGERST